MNDEHNQSASSNAGDATGQTNSGTGSDDSTATQNIASIQAELEQAKAKFQEMTQVAQRALADLQNFKRRAEEEKTSFISFANLALLNDFVPVIDNIHRSLEHEPKDAEWSKGLEQTLRQFVKILEKIGVTTMATTGQTFDPTLHEALLTGPGEKDKIMAELEKGYLFHDKVIKRARVKVGNGEEEKAE